MGEAIKAAAPYISVVSGLMSVGTALAGGAASSRAAEIQAQQYREQSENARVAAIQDEAQRRRSLEATLATQEAMRAGRGLSLYSPSGLTLRDSTTENAERDIATAKLNYLNQQRQFGLGAALAETQAEGALIGGLGGAVAGLGRAAGGVSKIPSDSS